jgi:hypothetical protein
MPAGVVAAGAAVIAIAACGGGGSTGPSASPGTRSPGASPLPTSGTAAQAAVKSTWQEFFNGRTATSRRVRLLENGQTLAHVIAAQAHLPTVSSVSTQVSKVQVTSPGQARVTYTLLESGSPVLTNQSGFAVFRNGRWQVTVKSFCGLLALENGGSAASLPAACRNG